MTHPIHGPHHGHPLTRVSTAGLIYTIERGDERDDLRVAAEILTWRYAQEREVLSMFTDMGYPKGAAA